MDTADLIKVIEEETGKVGVHLETRLDSLVEDSLEFLSLVAAVENAFGFRIPDKRYAEVQIVGDLHFFATDYVPSRAS